MLTQKKKEAKEYKIQEEKNIKNNLDLEKKLHKKEMEAVDKDIAAAKKKGIKEKADLEAKLKAALAVVKKTQTTLDTEIKTYNKLDKEVKDYSIKENDKLKKDLAKEKSKRRAYENLMKKKLAECAKKLREMKKSITELKETFNKRLEEIAELENLEKQRIAMRDELTDLEAQIMKYSSDAQLLKNTIDTTCVDESDDSVAAQCKDYRSQYADIISKIGEIKKKVQTTKDTYFKL